MTFLHSRTIFGFSVGFSDNNLCCLVFSSLCAGPLYYLWLHSPTLPRWKHTPLWLACLPWVAGRHYLLFFTNPDVAFVFSCPPPSLLPGHATSLDVYVVSHASLHLPTHPLLPPHPHSVSSFCYQPCFHNNCDLAVMRNHFLIRSRENREKMRGRARGR